MTTGAPPIRVHIPLDVAPGIRLALIRTDISQVFIHLTLSEDFQKEFDKHRFAVLWLDNNIVVDLCDLESTGKILEGIMPGRVFYNSDARTVLGVIWHGKPEEGTGFIGRVISCNSMKLRIYFRDYTHAEFDVDRSKIEAWKKDVARLILGVC